MIQGTAKGSHVRDKVTEMIHLSETLYSSSIACSAEGLAHSLRGPSWWTPCWPTSANTTSPGSISKWPAWPWTWQVDSSPPCPANYDLKSEEVGHLVQKYFSGAENIPTEERIKIGRLIEAMTGGTALVESMHGAGSPQAQRIMILREGRLAEKIKLAKNPGPHSGKRVEGPGKTVPKGRFWRSEGAYSVPRTRQKIRLVFTTRTAWNLEGAEEMSSHAGRLTKVSSRPVQI